MDEPKQPSWATSSLSHEQRRRQDDAQAGQSNGGTPGTFIPTLLMWSLRAGKQLVPSSRLCWSWVLLVPDWLIGVRLFSKRREQVNEPWIYAEWHGSRLTEQVAGQQEASSLNPLYSKSALDIPWQKSLIFTCRHESPVWMICREKGCFLGLQNDMQTDGRTKKKKELLVHEGERANERGILLFQ